MSGLPLGFWSSTVFPAGMQWVLASATWPTVFAWLFTLRHCCGAVFPFEESISCVYSYQYFRKLPLVFGQSEVFGQHWKKWVQVVPSSSSDISGQFFSQIHCCSSCSEDRSSCNPDLLRISSHSRTVPLSWLTCDTFVTGQGWCYSCIQKAVINKPETI